jgi:hypothetical protein
VQVLKVALLTRKPRRRSRCLYVLLARMEKDSWSLANVAFFVVLFRAYAATPISFAFEEIAVLTCTRTTEVGEDTTPREQS